MRSTTILAMVLASSLSMAQGTALVFDDTSSLGGAGGLQNSASAAATALGFTVTSHSDFVPFTAALGGPLAPDLVIVTHLNYGGMPNVGDLDALNTYLTGGGKLIFQSWNLVNQGLCAHPLFSTMQVTVNCSGGTASDLFVWDASHGMMMSSPSPTTYQDAVGFGIDYVAADPVAGQSEAIMGFLTPAASPLNGAVIPRDDLQAVYVAHFPQMMGPIPTQGELFLSEVISCMLNPTACGDNTTCDITAPLPSPLPFGGDVSVSFDVDDTQGDPVTAAFDWSTDGGLTFSPASAAPSSPIPNPALGLLTPGSAMFTWASATDGVGLTGFQSTTFRITVSDGMVAPGPSNCDTTIQIDNPIPPPNCVVLVTGGGPMPIGGDIGIQVDAGSPAGAPTVGVVLEYSLDGGATYNPCTMAGASPNPNPAAGLGVGVSDFTWASAMDMVGMAGGTQAQMRATIDDGGPRTGDCTIQQVIDNSQVCALCGDCNLNMIGPDILDALTAAQIAAGIVMAPPTQAACCDVNSSGSVDVIDALVMAQAAAGLPVMLTCI